MKASFQRKSYVWRKETSFTCDIPQGLAKQLLQTGQFEPVNMVIVKDGQDLKCGVCGFEAKSDFGLMVHKKKHKGN